MTNFYDLKKAMHFPDIAGTIRRKNDVVALLNLLIEEREKTYHAMHQAIRALVMEKKYGEAQQLGVEVVRVFGLYSDDIALIIKYIGENGIAESEEI